MKAYIVTYYENDTEHICFLNGFDKAEIRNTVFPRFARINGISNYEIIYIKLDKRD